MVYLRKSLLIVLIIVIFSSYALADESMEVDIVLSKNDIVTETITLTFLSDQVYDSLEFTTLFQPLSILYDGDFSIVEQDDLYIINFEKDIVVGENTITFTLIYDDIIDQSGVNKVFRTSFTPENSDSITISVSLPLFHVLSDKKPSATPKPSFIESDGQRIVLYWKFLEEEQADIVVFYKGQSGLGTIIFSSFVVIILISIVVYTYFRKKTKHHINEVLSSEELKVVGELRKGITKQKEISRDLNFSKSKMSKVVRKLEEKELIEKKPYFKTNIIKLSRKIK